MRFGMKAVGICAFGGIDQIINLDLPIPDLDPGEVLVRVLAASVNRLDVDFRAAGTNLSESWPIILGCDSSGVIVGSHPSVTDLAIGTPVVTMARPEKAGSGTYAEFVAVPRPNVARLPVGCDFISAAAMALSGVAAWQANYAIMPEPGETILIHGAAGGVGSLAIQLAKLDGATVVANARAEASTYCRELGADATVDGRAEDLTGAVRRLVPRGVDAVLDLVDRETQQLSATLFRPLGRLVTLLSVTEPALFRSHRVAAWNVQVRPDPDRLVKLIRMVASGDLRCVVAGVMPLQKAAQAHQRLEDGGVRGKLVLVMPDHR